MLYEFLQLRYPNYFMQDIENSLNHSFGLIEKEHKLVLWGLCGSTKYKIFIIRKIFIKGYIEKDIGFYSGNYKLHEFNTKYNQKLTSFQVQEIIRESLKELEFKLLKIKLPRKDITILLQKQVVKNPKIIENIKFIFNQL